MYKLITKVGKKTKSVAKNIFTKKILMLAVVAVCAISPAFAADQIAGKLTEIGSNFKGYVEPVRNIVYALAAVCAVIGPFTIYFKMTNGEQDVKKTIMLTVGGCAGLVALATALPSMFE